MQGVGNGGRGRVIGGQAQRGKLVAGAR